MGRKQSALGQALNAPVDIAALGGRRNLQSIPRGRATRAYFTRLNHRPISS